MPAAGVIQFAFYGRTTSPTGSLPGPGSTQDHAIPRELAVLREQIGTCEQKLTQYRAALDSGADPAVAGQWITQTQARKLAVGARLRAAAGTRPGPERMTKEQIAATVTAISDLMQALRDATTEDKTEIYAGLNLQLTYNPGRRTVNVSAGIGQTCTKGSCPRGGHDAYVHACDYR